MRFADIELEGNLIHARTKCDAILSWDVRTGKPFTYKKKFDSLEAALGSFALDLDMENEFDIATVPARRLAR